jgi:cell division protein ZapA (FtsZ GTPase activity inhibitor)
MFRIAKGYPRLDSQRIAVLAAVNIADECFQMNKELEELSKLQSSQEGTKARYKEL